MISRAAREALAEALGDQVRFDASLARWTSLGVGGTADVLATPTSREDLRRLLAVSRAHRLPHVVLGAGFNTLVLDGRLRGVVIQMGQLRLLEERPGYAIRAEAGVSHARVSRFCVERGLSGLEFAAGIPGTVGGWLAMNAGIPSREMKDTLRELEVVSPTGRRRSHLGRDALHFSYRSLRGLAQGSLIVSALFEVKPSTPLAVKAEVDRLLARRSRTQPLNVPSCGSVFKNPPGDFAGRLIEEAGLKGHRIGGAQISPLHANFIANVDGATASDVLALIDEARRAVYERAGVSLEPEVRIVGNRS